MIDNRKTMDFFRPTRSTTDPLVSRPVPKPGPTIIPAEKETSLPPALKASPNAEKERNVYNLSKPPVYSSSVIVEQTVISTNKPVREIEEEEDYFESELRKAADFENAQFDGDEDDDWFSSLKAEGFFNDEDELKTEEKPKAEPVKLERETKGRPLYSFTGESPFLKSVQVEKRPLSRSTPINKKTPVFDAPAPVTKKRETKKSAYVPPVAKKKKEKAKKDIRDSERKGLPFWATILITVVLGIAAGVAVFILIS